MTRRSCYFCSENNTQMLEEHHVVPRRFGGSDDDENLVTVCASCHNGLESLYNHRFYQELGVRKKDNKSKSKLKTFDKKNPFIWAVRSYCKKNAKGFTKSRHASDLYKITCDVGYFRRKWDQYVSDFTDRKILDKLQSDQASRCGLTCRRLEKRSVEENAVILEVRYYAEKDDFVDGKSVRDYDDNQLSYDTWRNA